MAEVIPLDPTRSGRTIGRTVSHGGASVGRQVGAAVGSAAGAVVGATTAGVRGATRRLTDEPAGATDEWGRNPVLVRNVMFLAQLRWDVTTGGDQHLPKRRGALIVVNASRRSLTPVFAAFAISEAVDRPVRFVGRPDDDIVGAFARRLGGLLDEPDEIAGALRADQLVVLGAPTYHHRPLVDHAIVGAAVATSTRVFPAAATSGTMRRARVEIGPSVRQPRRRRGPLTELELADRVSAELHELLDELGGLTSGGPLDLLGAIRGGRR